MHKKQRGQFFTEENPFVLEPFKEWFGFLPEKARLLEPFAGSNNLIKMVNETFGEFGWESFDIEPPQDNAYSDVPVQKKDTLKDMPSGFDAIITNPPYLARNSATRAGIKFDAENKYDDLYKFCLDKMLKKYDFVAAIIPESFMTCGQFREKLYSVISLTQGMFSDTDCPVCIATFVPEKIKKTKLAKEDFLIYRLDDFIGSYEQLEKYYQDLRNEMTHNVHCRFNDKNGKIGLRGVDNTIADTIRFVQGEEIDPSLIKQTSRSITRISVDVDLPEEKLVEVIDQANDILRDFRKRTDDIFMTSFKGLRRDGKYRRRLDYKKAGEILDVAINMVV